MLLCKWGERERGGEGKKREIVSLRIVLFGVLYCIRWRWAIKIIIIIIIKNKKNKLRIGNHPTRRSNIPLTLHFLRTKHLNFDKI